MGVVRGRFLSERLFRGWSAGCLVSFVYYLDSNGAVELLTICGIEKMP